MTRKRIVFVSALAAGATPDEAATAAGYTRRYALRLWGDSAVEDAVARRRAYLTSLDTRTRSKTASAALESDMAVMLRATIDESMPPRVRATAVVALRRHAETAPVEDREAIRLHLRMLAGDAGQHERVRTAALRGLGLLEGASVSRVAATGGDRAAGAACP